MRGPVRFLTCSFQINAWMVTSLTWTVHLFFFCLTVALRDQSAMCIAMPRFSADPGGLLLSGCSWWVEAVQLEMLRCWEFVQGQDSSGPLGEQTEQLNSWLPVPDTILISPGPAYTAFWLSISLTDLIIINPKNLISCIDRINEKYQLSCLSRS